MAGQIVVSSIKTDSDNSISFLANTGATIFSANLASGLSASSFGDNTITSDKIVSVANTKISGNIVSSQITSIANTQLTGTVTNAQVGESVYEGMMFRNRIINGDMRIDQRNAGASVNLSSSAVYSIDRWDVRLGTSTGSTTQQSTTAPAGFTNSLLLTIGTGASPSASAGTGYLDQTIEGFNIADLGWGAAGAKTITLSFWVRSSLTGSFGVCVTNGSINPSYPTSYTISSADTWEYKTITVPGPTSGTFNTNNTDGIRIFFDWGNGSNFKGTANTWANADYRGGATGTTSICATTGATWRVTGVQLEVGSVATPFERRPFGMELALCQRYYAKSYEIGTAPGTDTQTGLIAMRNWDTSSRSDIDIPIIWPVNMRAVPTFTAYSKSGSSGYISEGVDGSFTDKSFNGSYNSSSKGIYAIATGGIGSLAFATLHYTASAEL